MDVQPRVLELGEEATLTITIEDQRNAPAPSPPMVPDFQVEPAGTQTSFQFINSRQSSSVAYSFRLTPTRTGTFSVGPFSYVIGNQSLDLPAVQVQVVGRNSPAGTSSTESTSDRLFARIEADTTNIFYQQSFDLSIAIYSQGFNLDRNVELVDMPTTGLQLQQFHQVSANREVFNGQAYDVRRFKCRATALTAGQFTLAPTLRVGILVQRKSRGDFDPFGFFGGGVESRPRELPTQPLVLNIRPVPQEGRPAGYAGAVGAFDFDAQMTPTEVNAGEPITLTMSISGRGNLDMVSPPALAQADGFRVYEPKMTVNDLDGERGSGRRVFEQVLIPKSDKVKELGALSFSFLNPETGRYETQTRGPFPIVVHFSSNEAARIVQSTPSPAEPTRVILGADIGYLKLAPRHWQASGDRALFTRPIFIGAQCIPPLALAFIFFTLRRRESLEQDITKARRHRAPRAARSALAHAEKALHSGDRTAYYEQLWSALANYFGDRFNLAPGEVDRAIVGKRIGYLLEPTVADEMNNLFAHFEQERFGSAGAKTPLTEEDRNLVGRVRQLLRACEETRG